VHAIRCSVSGLITVCSTAVCTVLCSHDARMMWDEVRTPELPGSTQRSAQQTLRQQLQARTLFEPPPSCAIKRSLVRAPEQGVSYTQAIVSHPLDFPEADKEDVRPSGCLHPHSASLRSSCAMHCRSGASLQLWKVDRHHLMVQNPGSHGQLH
jgi:hypothetical protein